MLIEVRETAAIPEHLAQVAPGTGPDALNMFLKNFAIMFRKRMGGDIEWIRTAKDVAMAKEIIKAVGGERAATALATDYFNASIEDRPDDYSMYTFKRWWPKRAADLAENEQWVQRRAVGEMRAAERGAHNPEFGSPEWNAEQAKLDAENAKWAEQRARAQQAEENYRRQQEEDNAR